MTPTATETPTATPTPTETPTPTPTITPTATPDRFAASLKGPGFIDTFLSGMDPQVNYAAAPLLTISEKPGDRNRALIHLDLQPVPDGSVLAAALRLHITYRSGAVGGRSLQVHRLLHTWDVATANWYLATSNAAWAQAGAGGAGSDYQSTPTAVEPLN